MAATSVRLAAADLRDSWSAWLAVSLTFVATSAAVGLCALGLNSTLTASASGAIIDEASQLLSFSAIFNLVITSVVGLAVVGASTGLVVTSRRGAIARLLLAGAAPGQVIRMLAVQLGVVALVCSSIGNVMAGLMQPTVLRHISEDRGYAPPPALLSLPILLSSSAFCVGVALVGGLRQARRATRIPPVEGLRASTGLPPQWTPAWKHGLRLVFLGGCALVVAGAAIALVGSAEEFGAQDAQQNLMQLAFMTLPLMGLALAVAAPTLVGPLTRLWTSVLPVPGPTWHLARHTVAARADRLVKSVVPVMFVIGLIFGITMLSDTMVKTLALSGMTDLEGTSIVSVLSLVGLPLVVAVAGSVGNLVMMSRQRDAELALSGVIGATPAQQRLLPTLEAVIVVGTASILGLVMASVPPLVLFYGMRYIFDQSEFGFPVGTLAAVVLLTSAVTVAATVLPSLRSLRLPAPKVIARLIAS